MYRVWCVLVLAIALPGCTSTVTTLAPNLGLNAVQRPEDVAERWGEYTLEPADTSGYLYEDGLISLAVVPLSGTFSTFIENRTEHSIRLLWSEASYVGPAGVATGVVPGETRWIDMGNVPGPQIIPSRASASVVAIPKANANTSTMEIESFYDATATCNEIEATELRLILPLEIEGVTNEYTLLFKPRQVEAVTYERDELSGRTTELSRTPC